MLYVISTYITFQFCRLHHEPNSIELELYGNVIEIVSKQYNRDKNQ